MKRDSYLITFLILTLRVASQSYSLTTIAGNGNQGFSGDGDSAIHAEFNSCNFTVEDKNGNLYVSDNANNRIRKINPQGIISTFAGNGQLGFSGDGGPAINAQFNFIQSLVIDYNSNILYVEDRFNLRIRKIDIVTGIISTYAGNGNAGFVYENVPANSTSVNFIDAMTCDASGNLYLAVGLDAKIFRINKSNQLITAFAGNGTFGYSGDGGSALQAQIQQVESICMDNNGNMYLSHEGTVHYIRKINSSGIITTIAGTGVSGFSGDGGLATLAALNVPRGLSIDYQGNLVFSDSFNYTVRKINLSTNIINTIFTSPYYVVFEGNTQGTKFYSSENFYVKKLYTDVITTTVITTGINENNGVKNSFTIYPSVSSGIFSIETEFTENFNLSISDITGKKFIHEFCTASYNNNQMFKKQINLSSFNDGLYFVTIQLGNKNICKRLIKKSNENN